MKMKKSVARKLVLATAILSLLVIATACGDKSAPVDISEVDANTKQVFTKNATTGETRALTTTFEENKAEGVVEIKMSKKTKDRGDVKVTTLYGNSDGKISNGVLTYKGQAPTINNPIISIEVETEKTVEIDLTKHEQTDKGYKITVPFNKDVRGFQAKSQIGNPDLKAKFNLTEGADGKPKDFVISVYGLQDGETKIDLTTWSVETSIEI